MNYFKKLLQLSLHFIRHPGQFTKSLNNRLITSKAEDYTAQYDDQVLVSGFTKNDTEPIEENPLFNYFQNHKTGNGIWKWHHYFQVYHQYFNKFRGGKVKILEVGIYSGGSLEMWREYFGEEAQIYGVDIESACKGYEKDNISIHIGDQADRGFWKKLIQEIGPVDIVIDDGGHKTEQQRITLEEMLPNINSGGIYICEDMMTDHNYLQLYATSLIEEMNKLDSSPMSDHMDINSSPFQRAIHAMHFYPYLMVIEKNESAVDKISLTKQGTQWQPFFD